MSGVTYCKGRGWSQRQCRGCWSNLFFFFWPHSVAYRILVLQEGPKPMPSAVEARSFTHWITREFPVGTILRGYEPCPGPGQELKTGLGLGLC